MPTMIGVICPLPRLTVLTKLMMVESFGAAVSGVLVTHRFEQTEYTPEALSAMIMHPFDDVGHTVSSTGVPTPRTFTDCEAVPGLWMKSSCMSP